MTTLEELLEANGRWAGQTEREKPGFLQDLAVRQSPAFLWIGCADSRVPPGIITGSPPGSLFVHRNIANIAGEDTESLAVIQYAVGVLAVRHVVVCGHYGCGGVRAAMGDLPSGHVGEWISPVRYTYGRNRARIDSLGDQAERENLLSELNVREQVEKLSQVAYVRTAWQSGQELSLHGLVYNLADGKLKNLECSRSAP